MNKKPTVTIGIPAHNEESNIASMLDSVISQEKESFVLERVIVALDGCTDNTESVVREFAKKYPVIELIADGKRMGKKERLNQIYAANKSDFIFTLDADIILANSFVLEEMVGVFLNDDDACLVAAHQVPVTSKGFIGKIIYYHYSLWDKVRVPVNGGDHIHNLHGAASGLRKKFANSFRYPKEIASDAGFLYVMAYKQFGFRYAKDAVIFYRVPETLLDFKLHSARSLFSAQKELADYFGRWIYGLFEIPREHKVKGVLEMALRHPIFTILTISLGILVRIKPQKDNLIQRGMWSIATTTKIKI